MSTKKQTPSPGAPKLRATKRVPAKVKRPKSNYTIQSVAHAFDVLEVFETGGAEFGVTELSRRLKLHKNNVFRLLATLEARGYIEQNKATENYRLGVKSLELGQAFIRQTGVLRQARPVVQELMGELQETCYVAVIRNRRVVHIDAAEPERTVRVVAELGTQLPVHSTASGKAQLAFESGDEIERVLGEPLERSTESTLTDPAALRQDLMRVVKLGYAVEDEEHEEGVRSVAAPIRDYTGRVVGAIALSAPAYRVSRADVEREVGPAVARAAMSISNRLGFGLEAASA